MVKVNSMGKKSSESMKKKKKMKINRCSSAVKEIQSDILVEVLTRLPIKDLDRVKCVSPSWASLICNPEFMKGHKACGGIFIHLLPLADVMQPLKRSWNSTKSLLYASIHGKDEVFARRFSLPYLCYEDMTPVVNGLACLYTGHQVSLFNISTRELMELPPSGLCGKGHSVWYALGFDSVDNVYKLLKVCTIADYLAYEILTLETSSRSTWRWRRIFQEGLPLFASVSVQGYFLNGLIFCKFRKTQEFFRIPGKQYLLAFDVHQEHFTIFKPPSAPSSIEAEFSLSFTVFGQFEGHIALARVKKTQFETVLEVWALRDHLTSLWSKHKINMPDEIIRYFFKVTPVGNLPTGELLLCGLDGTQTHNSFFIYDSISEKYKKLMVKIPYPLQLTYRSFSCHITCLFEKITPMEVILGLRKKE